MNKGTQKILIKEGLTHGCGATLYTIGAAYLQVESITLGVRIERGGVGSSDSIVDDPRVVPTVRLDGTQFILQEINDLFADGRHAIADGCKYEVTVPRGRLTFKTSPPTCDPVQLVNVYEDYERAK